MTERNAHMRLPTAIRGTVYPSVRVAAEVIGVPPQTISTLNARGRIDQAGVGRGNHENRHPVKPPKPYRIGLYKFESEKAASLALGMAPGYVSHAIKGGKLAKARLLRREMEYIAKRERAEREAEERERWKDLKRTY